MISNARYALNRMSLAALAAGFSGAIAAAQPNVEVRIDGAIQTPNQEFVFDATDVGQSTPLIVVVRNIGSQSLQFPSSAPVFLGGGFAGQFSLIQPPLETGNMLSPNGSTAFRVDFVPTLAKRFLPATVSIPTNDPDTPIFSLRLRGVVPVPEMVVSRNGQVIAPQSQVNLPSTPIGDSSEIEITIANQGERPLVLTDAVETFGGFGSGAFTVVQPGVDSLQPSESTSFFIVFAPTQTGSATSNVGINSNDVGNFPNGRFTFVVRGVGAPAQDGGDDEADPQDDGGGTDDDTDDNGGGQNGNEQNDGGDENDGDNENSGQTGDDEDGGTVGSAPGDDGLPNGGAGGDGQVDDEADDADENAGDDDGATAEVLAPMGICGFGAPLGLACALASLAARRATGRRRSR